MRAQKDMQKAPVANYTSLQDQLLELREGEQKDTAYLNAAQRIRIRRNPSPLNDTKPANLMTWYFVATSFKEFPQIPTEGRPNLPGALENEGFGRAEGLTTT